MMERYRLDSSGSG